MGTTCKLIKSALADDELEKHREMAYRTAIMIALAFAVAPLLCQIVALTALRRYSQITDNNIEQDLHFCEV